VDVALEKTFGQIFGTAPVARRGPPA
jgi:hypothetical protein